MSSLYRLCVADKMMEKGYTTFRDAEEMDQATRFLHENGKMLHITTKTGLSHSFCVLVYLHICILDIPLYFGIQCSPPYRTPQ